MKILVCANDDLAQHNGFVRLLEYMCTAVVNLGHEVLVLGNATGDPTLSIPHVVSRGNGAISKFETACRTLQTAVFGNYRVVVLTQMAAPFNGLLASLLRLFGKRLLYIAMDPPAESYGLLLGDSLTVRALTNLVRASETVIDRCVEATFTISPGVEKLLRAEGWRGKIHLFYNIHGTEAVEPRPSTDVRKQPGWEDAVIVVYAGGLQRSIRGIEEQLEAVELARNAGANVRLLMIGFGDRDAFANVAMERGIAEAVLILDQMPPQQLSSYLWDADAAVFASLPFALPSKIFEYVAHDLRIVSYAGESDVNTLLAQFVEPCEPSPHGLAAALMNLKRRVRTSDEVSRNSAFLQRLRTDSLAPWIAEVQALEHL